MSAERQFEFRYSLPEPAGGTLVELLSDEAERLLLRNLSDAGDNPRDVLWELARFYSVAKRHEQALDCFRRVMGLHPDLEHKAGCVLAMGQIMEQIGDYESAARYYQEAFVLEPVNTRTWYFINNNLGFSLNTLGRFEDGERYCRAAIGIDSRRPNGFKNLGIPLRGQNRFEEAARCFIQATQADASDSRSLKLLEELLARHPELNFATELDCCRQAVHLAGARRQSMQPVVHRGWRKHLILAWLRIVSWLKRRR